MIRVTIFVATIFVFFSFGYSHGVEANNIYGTVFIKGENLPLSNVTLFVEGNDVISATTDANGNFNLIVMADGEYKISAFAMGYEKGEAVSVTVSGGKTTPDEVILYLLPEMNTLSEVIVKAERNPDRVSKVILSGKVLETLPGAGGDPLKAIQAYPGVTTGNDSSGDPAIRGTGPDDNLYYVDFFPVGTIFHMGGLVSVVNADLVDDFNLYTAGYGVEYGDIFGGVIDVNLREPRTDRFGLKLQAGFFEADFVAEGPVSGNSSLLVSGRRSYFDLIIPPDMLSNEEVEIRTIPNYSDYHIKYVHNIDCDNKLVLMANGSRDALEIYTKPGSNLAIRQLDMVGITDFGTEWNGAGASVTTNISANASNKFGAHLLVERGDYNLANVGRADLLTHSYVVKDRLNWRFTDAHNLLLGFEARRTEFAIASDLKFETANQFLVEPDFHTDNLISQNEVIPRNETVLFAKDRWKATEKLTIVPGIRITDDEQPKKTIAEPRLGIEYDMTDSMLVTAGWGKYHQHPQFSDLFPNHGNRELGFIKGEQIVAGIEKKISEIYSIKGEVYQKIMSDIIVPNPDAEPAQGKKLLNGGTGEAKGVELLLKKNAGDEGTGWLSASWSESKRRNDLIGQNISFAYDQPLIVNLVCTRPVGNGWSFGMRWRYQSGQPYTPVTGTCTYANDGLGCTTPDDQRVRPIYGEINSERLPDYHRLDLRFDKDKVYDSWKFGYFIEFINAYARKNVGGYQYNEDYSEKEAVLQMPFMPGFGIKAEF